MATVEERMKILKMIEEGKISASDGAELLRALEPFGRAGGHQLRGFQHIDERSTCVCFG